MWSRRQGEWAIVANFVATVFGAIVFFALNLALAVGLVALRTGQSFASVLNGNSRKTLFNSLALAPLGLANGDHLLHSWWATLLFALPLYTTRQASQRFVEMREMFTQTIGALAEAVDKRDPYTASTSQRVKDDRGRHRAA